MFRDPYSERQAFFNFFSRNKVFFRIAMILVVVAVVELTLLFRMPRDPGFSSGRAESEKQADAAAGRDTERQEPSAPAAPETDDSLSPGKPGGDWKLVLVNDKNPLPENYQVSLVNLRSGVQVDERIYDPLTRMLEAAGEERLTIVAASGYRSADRQKDLYENKVRRLMTQGMDGTQAKEEAVREVAYPGTSEHQLGLAVDLVSYHNQRMDDSQGETKENQWLREHSQEYGFILRYPGDKSEITGVIYEPWHFRYIGVEAAKSVTEHGLCLEEYIVKLNDNQ